MKRRFIPATVVLSIAFLGCGRGGTVQAAARDVGRPAGTGADESPVVTPAARLAPDTRGAQSTRRERDGRTGDAEYREVTIPAGTVLALELKSSVSSERSRVEDPVRATLRRSIRVGDVTAVPAGTAVAGHVTSARRSGRVKGRAQVGMRFTQLDLPREGGRVAIRTSGTGRVAPGTKKRDAAEIGGGAAGGAIIGGIVGGGSGAAKGSAIGGAAGTGVVLSTRGKEVALRPGTRLSVRLLAPVTVRVPLR